MSPPKEKDYPAGEYRTTEAYLIILCKQCSSYERKS